MKDRITNTKNGQLVTGALHQVGAGKLETYGKFINFMDGLKRRETLISARCKAPERYKQAEKKRQRQNEKRIFAA